jgi:hypothetical protein
MMRGLVLEWMDRHDYCLYFEQYRGMLEIFLNEIWGPVAGFDFKELEAGYPKLEIPFRHSFHVTYCMNGVKIAFEFIGETFWEARRKEAIYRRWNHRYMHLTLDGWKVLRITSEMLNDNKDDVRRLMRKVIEMTKEGVNASMLQ